MKAKIILGIVIIGMVVILMVQHLAQVKLRQQNEAFQQQTNQRSQNQRLSGQLAEVKKSNAVASQQLSATTQNSAEKSQETNPVAAGSIASPDSSVNELPKDSWTNAGFASPEDTLKTRGWSVVNADRDAFKQSIYITDDARKFAEDQFIKMAEASNDPNKAQYIQDILDNKLGVDEAILMPMMAANQNNPFTSYKILSEKSSSADEMILQVETETASAPAQTETLDFQRFGNDWKIVYDKATIQNMMQSH